ncbi:MAG: LysR family transcriptional regulator [Megasphaera massiliensis]|uniref:LysR family transcriptional regulator n=1 Tax=Megasphaera massiliensis TaxID=1232428 RepID=UPI002A750433|nr:LysR family transcriptional regulator [Megasphaera massiliensis]MDY2966566.1 LysR family transcriptional regulator [Megasphaera massiliensis]
MTTKQIEYILELAQTLNFNRAAENLYISQPTMTYQIKAAEEEIGFAIFERTGKGASLTPAGAQFVGSLRSIHQALKDAIEQGQNFSAKFNEDIRIALPYRSAIYFLPQAIYEFSRIHPGVSITPSFGFHNQAFLNDEQDILFAMKYEMKRVPNVVEHHLFDSRFYVISESDDSLAHKEKVTTRDLPGRTLMVGGGSPPVLRALQQKIIQEIHIDYFNSPDHDTTLTNVAAHRGICIAPGFLNGHCGAFAWTPFDTEEKLPCALYTHKGDSRKHVWEFVESLQKMYRDRPDFPV